MIYIHVPFCRSRCIYCDFYSTTQTEEVRHKYVESLCKEIKKRKEYLPSSDIDTIYFGGGTPSLLTIPELYTIMNCISHEFNVNSNVEITLEANPDDVTPELVKDLSFMGFNRMSLGVQSFNDDTLHLLNRRHSSEAAVTSVETIVNNGIENISIDLIYGLPEQSFEDFYHDLHCAFSLPIKHLSSYALSVEQGTVLNRKIEKRELILPDEDLFLREYNVLLDMAALKGFNHYEISNFALPGYQSRHNSGYWTGKPYLGCGPGAHSYDGQNRYSNAPDLLRYISESGNPPHELEVLDEKDRFNEFVMESLRMSSGIDLQKLESRYGNVCLNKVLVISDKHIKHGFLEINKGFLKLTRKGIFISNDIMSDFMM